MLLPVRPCQRRASRACGCWLPGVECRAASAPTPCPSPRRPTQYHSRVGAQITSHSWGSNTRTYNTDSRQFDSSLWRNPAALHAVAAGNDGDVGGAVTIGSPGTAKNVLSVGASINALLASQVRDIGDESGTAFNSLAYFRCSRAALPALPDAVEQGPHQLAVPDAQSVGEVGVVGGEPPKERLVLSFHTLLSALTGPWTTAASNPTWRRRAIR
jgi:hypothetical protein